MERKQTKTNEDHKMSEASVHQRVQLRILKQGIRFILKQNTAAGGQVSDGSVVSLDTSEARCEMAQHDLQNLVESVHVLPAVVRRCSI